MSQRRIDWAAVLEHGARIVNSYTDTSAYERSLAREADDQAELERLTDV